METLLPRTKTRVPHLDISQEKDGKETDRQTKWEPHRERAKADNKKKRLALPLAHLSTHLTLSSLGLRTRWGNRKIFFFNEVYFIYNVMLLSAVQLSDSVIHICALF